MIDFFVNPDLDLIRKCVGAVNEGINAKFWPFLARNSPLDAGVAETWLSGQNSSNEVRVVGVNSAGIPVVIAYFGKCHGRASLSARFAITVHPSVEGRGYAHEAYTLLSSRAVSIGVERIEALPVISNVRAVNFLLRNGFVREGIAARRFTTDDGKREDCIYMAATVG